MTWYSGFPSTTEGWEEFNRNEAEENAARHRNEERKAREEISERLNDITNALHGNKGSSEIMNLKNRIRKLENENAELRKKLGNRPKTKFDFLYDEDLWETQFLDKLDKLRKGNK